LITTVLLFIVSLVLYPEIYPWAPDAACKLNPAKPRGLHPDAYAALRSLTLAHRITRGINHSAERGNVHDTDGTVNGKAYTGAVDISVRCLTQVQIRTLLARLATAGFAAWYRKDSQDGWTGPPHIHARWAGCRLKPVLRQQVENWLVGGNDLFSKPALSVLASVGEMRGDVGKLYHLFN